MLEHFRIEIKPWVYEGINDSRSVSYEIRAKYNGIDYNATMVKDIPSYMTEIEYMNRLSLGIRDNMRERDEKR